MAKYIAKKINLNKCENKCFFVVTIRWLTITHGITIMYSMIYVFATFKKLNKKISHRKKD